MDVLKSYKIILALSTVLFMLSSCVNLTESDFYGTWNGIHNGKNVSLTFTNNECTLSYYDSLETSDITLTGSYDFDFTKRPIPFSITKINQINNSLHSIVRLTDHRTMQLVEFSTEWRLRPISFEENRVVELRKQ